MTITLPTRFGPDCRNASDSRSHCGRPPTTLRPSRRSACMVCGPQAPSGEQPDLALELGHRAGGAGAVDAVGAADVVPHLQQPFLQRPYVLAGERVGDRLVEGAGAEPPAGGVQRAPGLGADLAVDAEATALLEGAYRVLDRPPSNSSGRAGSVGGEQVEADQDASDLGDRGTAVTTSDRTHRRPPLRVLCSVGLPTGRSAGSSHDVLSVAARPLRTLPEPIVARCPPP